MAIYRLALKLVRAAAGPAVSIFHLQGDTLQIPKKSLALRNFL
jgi:hypothetical protein